MTVITRMLPSYAEHAGRRAVEMREVEEMAQAAGVNPSMTAAVREVHEQLASIDFQGIPKNGDWSSLLELLTEKLVVSNAAASAAAQK